MYLLQIVSTNYTAQGSTWLNKYTPLYISDIFPTILRKIEWVEMGVHFVLCYNVYTNMFKYSHFVNNSSLSGQFEKLPLASKWVFFIFFSWKIRPRHEWFQTRTLESRVWGPPDKELIYLSSDLGKISFCQPSTEHALKVPIWSNFW